MRRTEIDNPIVTAVVTSIDGALLLFDTHDKRILEEVKQGLMGDMSEPLMPAIDDTIKVTFVFGMAASFMPAIVFRMVGRRRMHDRRDRNAIFSY